MERNADDTFATPVSGQDVGGGITGGTIGTGSTGTGSPSTGSTATGTGGVGAGGGAGATRSTKDTLQDKFGQAREKAKQVEYTLADKLEQGAQKLRQRTQPSELAGATDGGSVGVATDERANQVRDSLAGGMQNTADWLRNGDLKADIETQVREHPGRTLLIALGLGYVLGKAIRR